MDRATRNAKRVLIVGKLDRFANGVRPVEIEGFLRARGHEVRLVNTYYLSRASAVPGSIGSKLPQFSAERLLLYLVEAGSTVLRRRSPFGRRFLSYYLFLAAYRLRRSILRSSLPLDDLDLIVCEHPDDAGVLTVATSARTLYDCPTPRADEMYFEGELTERLQRKLRRFEAALFESVDHLAFHWETYARYAVEHYGISGRNLLTLNWGCNVAAQRARFNKPVRIVYFGSLGARFIDLALLSRLTKLYPHVDVYGGPAPDPSLELNYRGYAPPSVLQQYQLGLITCTRDELRRDGFSAKHLQYLSYGLPVLVPTWRRHMDLLRGSVAYDEHTFRAVIDGLSNEDAWRRVSDEAYAQARRLVWDHTLRPLEGLLAGL